MVTLLLQEHVARKMTAVEGGLVEQTLERQYHCRNVFSGQVDLAYNMILYIIKNIITLFIQTYNIQSKLDIGAHKPCTRDV